MQQQEKSNPEKIVIRAFYRFVDLPNFERLKKPFDQFTKSNKMLGTILLAAEGINSTISAPKEIMDKFWKFLDQDPRFANMSFKESYADFSPFERMRVRLKKEIVRLGYDGLDISKRGQYVKGEDWDRLISSHEVVLVDTRNDYEYAYGSFENALNPKTEDFREFPEWVDKNLDPKKHKKVAMFCTGGIRCEKSTALMLQKGFEEVYHLEGGILQYFEDTKNKNKKWNGTCFVFDDRIAVNPDMQPVEGVVNCKKCSKPVAITPEMKRVNNKGVSCFDAGTPCEDYEKHKNAKIKSKEI
jgi:UPF0176 protein